MNVDGNTYSIDKHLEQIDKQELEDEYKLFKLNEECIEDAKKLKCANECYNLMMQTYKDYTNRKATFYKDSFKDDAIESIENIFHIFSKYDFEDEKFELIRENLSDYLLQLFIEDGYLS